MSTDPDQSMSDTTLQDPAELAAQAAAVRAAAKAEREEKTRELRPLGEVPGSSQAG